MCREFQRGACKRAESECRFAHPADSVTANEDGTVTVCMDAVKGRCNRDPCRYFHPPLHLQAQIKAAQSRASAVCYAVLGRTLISLLVDVVLFVQSYKLFFFFSVFFRFVVVVFDVDLPTLAWPALGFLPSYLLRVEFISTKPRTLPLPMKFILNPCVCLFLMTRNDVFLSTRY